MRKFGIINTKPRSPADWVLARIKQHRVTDIDPEEEHNLEAMSHWRDPAERLRSRRRRAHTLVDDNPASG